MDRRMQSRKSTTGRKIPSMLTEIKAGNHGAEEDKNVKKEKAPSFEGAFPVPGVRLELTRM